MFDNKNSLSPISEDVKKFMKLLSVLVLVLALFVAVLIVNASKSFSYIGEENPPYATVSFSGEGEVFAVPDTATFSFSVIREAGTAEEAQAQVSENMNSVLSLLEERGVSDEDIKTVGYNLYPRYEYGNNSPDLIYREPGARTLVGYEVNHTVSVKVRNIDEAGEILSQVGGMNVSNISSLSFTLGDEDEVLKKARKMAIEDAKSKAESTARDLGVKLARIVDFYEGGNGFPVQYAREESLAADASFDDAIVTPQVPAGENRILSRVTITYEIR